ncbi:unnamed protein product [Symbiodinium necroappetens]|uniref:Uncharacterized protein n=1 Tax=Symbiodinium necroappetens TaxID=1628268 RepID=A0A812T237_9DINO|nr:unnamed protein product [Symbiodinium necroappetens]
MDFGSLTSFETGSVELLEFSWPPAAEDQTSQVCLAYVIMKRPSGFLLCVPDGFLSQTELEQGQQAGEEEGIGPSTGISAPPVQLSPSGEWISPPDLDPVAALIVDLAAPLADQLSPADLSVGIPDGSFRAGNFTSQVVAAVVDRLDSMLLKGATPPHEPPPAPQPAVPHPVLGQPLAQAVLPPFQSVPKNLATTLGPPPLTRQLPPAAPVQVDLEEKGQQSLLTGELPGTGQDGSLASAVLAQSHALVALVTQLSGSADPLLAVPSGQASVRGAAGRAKLQQDLAARSGAFAQKVRDNMTRRMDPTGLLPEDQALDLIAIGATDGAKDCLSLLLLMLDQTAHDRGNSSLGWLLTLQADPPSNLFTPLQSFSPLAEQRWITTALAYAKEQQLSKKQLRAAQWAARKAAGSCAPPTGPNPVSLPPDGSFAPAFELGVSTNPAISAYPSSDGGVLDNDRADAFPLQGLFYAEEALPSSAALFPLPLLREGVFHQQACRSAKATFRDDVARCTSMIGSRGLSERVPARLSEVVVFLRAQHLEASGYPSAAEPPTGFVPHAPDGPEALRPYRDILANQVVLHGESKQELHKLAVFGAYKAPGKQRQIGAAYRERPGSYCIDPALYTDQLALGDAGGVEFATAGHEGPWQGLIIDDFFALAVLPGSFSNGTPSPSSGLVDLAKAGYARESVLGSDDKDVRDQRLFKVAGAEIDSSESTVLEGVTLCGYPVAKRLALAAASVRAAQCPALSEELVSTLCGSWVSCLLYRRCLMSALDRLFSLGRSEAAQASPGSDLKPLPRSTASELQLLAVLAPIAVSNLSAAPAEQVYASDASMEKGAYCCTEVPAEVALQLWLASDFKGAAVSLEGSNWRRPRPGDDEELSLAPAPLVEKPLAFDFDVLEVGEPSLFLDEAKARRLKVGPSLRCTRSCHYDLASPRFCEWLVHLVCTKQVRALVLRPPVDTFARASRPPARSVLSPLGFRQSLWPVLRANKAVSTCFAVLLAAARHNIPACLFHPASSLLCLHPAWVSLRRRAVCWEELLEAKLFGLPDSPALRVLCCGLPSLQPRLPPPASGRRHGDRTPLFRCRAFVRHLAGCLASVLHGDSPAEPPRTQGFESLLVNDLLLASRWKVVSEWRWRRRVHINVLETLAAVKVARKATEGSDCEGQVLFAFAAACTSEDVGHVGCRPLCCHRGAPPFVLSCRPAPHPVTCESFDQTLGFPGGPVLPRHEKDHKRQQQRVATPLPEGHDNKGYLEWPAEEVARALARYGRELFEAGLPYWHLSETINSVSAKRPAVRRQLQGAWDVAFAWMALEPRTHHVAMPAAVVLLAVLAVSLLWGWRQEAGLFGLAWRALLRIGEATGALREALVLPRDVLYTQAFALLKIEEPKTRFRVARHQAAKLEASDLVALVDMAFGKLCKGSKLWPFSAQTLRRRLDAILEALWIPTSRTSRRPLDLGSFRPGGATYLLQATEDSELVRRRGRWVSHMVMEVYLQEVAASTYYPGLPEATKRKVMDAAAAFPLLLDQATRWTQGNIPTGSWYYLWSL